MRRVRISVFNELSSVGEKGATSLVIGWPDQLNGGDVGHLISAICTALEARGIETTSVVFNSSSKDSRASAK